MTSDTPLSITTQPSTLYFSSDLHKHSNKNYTNKMSRFFSFLRFKVFLSLLSLNNIICCTFIKFHVNPSPNQSNDQLTLIYSLINLQVITA